MGCERTALCAFLMIVLLLPITACRENPLVPNHDTRYGWLQLLILASRTRVLDSINACTPRMMMTFIACQRPSRLTSSVVFDVGRAAKAVEILISVRVSKQMHAHVYLSRHANGVLVYLLRLALSQTWPSAQRLLYAWLGVDDTPRRPEAGGPRRDASETFSRRPTRLRIPLAYFSDVF